MISAVMHLIQVYNISLILFLITPYLIFYLKSKSLDVGIEPKNKIIIILFSISFGFLFLFIDLISYENSLVNLYIIKQSSEFFWISSFILLIYLYFSSFLWKQIFFKSLFIETDLSAESLGKIISKTNKKMNLQAYPNNKNGYIVGYLPGSYFTKFEVTYDIKNTDKKGFEIFLVNSLRNFRILSILSLITIFPMLLARSLAFTVSSSETVSTILIYTFNYLGESYPIDTVSWFIIGLLIVVFFGITLSSIQENILIEYEENFKGTKIREALELPKLSIKKPKIQIDSLKEKLNQKREDTLKLVESKKNEEIKRVIGDRIDLKKEKSINPEIIRLDALIRLLKNILSSTPIHKQITLDEILSVVNLKAKTDIEELEAIIIGLISKKDIQGEYNIWNKTYQGGTPVQRYISNYLSKSDSSKDNIAAFKLQSNGSLEIYFNNEGKIYKIKDDENQSKSTTDRK